MVGSKWKDKEDLSGTSWKQVTTSTEASSLAQKQIPTFVKSRRTVDGMEWWQTLINFFISSFTKVKVSLYEPYFIFYFKENPIQFFLTSLLKTYDISTLKSLLRVLIEVQLSWGRAREVA